MPPVPNLLPAPQASRSISGVSLSTTGMSFAAGSLCGSAVNRPSMSENRMRRSARIVRATMAASVSLSPMPSSCVATVSFSLMMGSVRSCSSRASVLWKFFARSGVSMSSAVMSSYATTWWYCE